MGKIFRKNFGNVNNFDFFQVADFSEFKCFQPAEVFESRADSAPVDAFLNLRECEVQHLHRITRRNCGEELGTERSDEVEFSEVFSG
jgi:hypothetical protein